MNGLLTKPSVQMHPLFEPDNYEIYHSLGQVFQIHHLR